MTRLSPKTGYAQVNDVNLYYERYGSGEPLIVLHGGFGLTDMFGDVLAELARSREVVAVDLQGHGRTADSDRPLRYELMADDIAGLIEQLAFPRADLMGYSLGANVALRAAIQHPSRIRKLVVISTPFKRSGWYPEVRAAMEQLGAAAAEHMRGSPMYESYARVAPHPERFPALVEKTGELLRLEYDWADAIRALKLPVLLVFGDADNVPPAHVAQFFELLGGGRADAGWGGASRPHSRLAILPDATHYTIFASRALAPIVTPFLTSIGRRRVTSPAAHTHAAGQRRTARQERGWIRARPVSRWASGSGPQGGGYQLSSSRPPPF